ncbi:MAG: hypothetical protein H6740_02915 [Alphaproteobacteria bacterium]|nr:hypothetical protein [Alphaproteobacteria bacterium]
MLILLSLLGCHRDLPPAIDPIGCTPEGDPMALGSAEAFLDLWFDELSYEILDHLTLHYALDSYAEGAIDASVRGGVEPCPSIHYRDDGFDVDAGAGCEAGDGSRWAGRAEVTATEGLNRTVYEGFAMAWEDPQQGDMDIEWTGTFEIGDDQIAELTVEGRRVGDHDNAVPAAGWAGRLEIHSDGQAEVETSQWVVEENYAAPALVGGLCVINEGQADGGLQVRARGVEDLRFDWEAPCASGELDGEPFEDLCL